MNHIEKYGPKAMAYSANRGFSENSFGRPERRDYRDLSLEPMPTPAELARKRAAALIRKHVPAATSSTSTIDLNGEVDQPNVHPYDGTPDGDNRFPDMVVPSGVETVTNSGRVPGQND